MSDDDDDALIDDLELVGRGLEGGITIEGLAARGGHALVYSARRRQPRSRLAIKVLRPQAGTAPPLDEDELDAVRAGFVREAEVYARLQHPSIAPIVAYSAVALPRGGAVAYLALPWLPGGSLADELEARAGRGRTPTEMVALLGGVLDAFAYAHTEGVAHRDVKPDNLLFDASGSLRVVDFGVAKLVDPEDVAARGTRATTRSVLRTYAPAWAAQEQVLGETTGPWTDVHALGLVVTAVLTGRVPYGDTDDTAVLLAQARNPTRPTPAALGVAVGPALEAVIGRALALAVTDRYPDAGAFRDALVAAIRADAPAAPPSPPSSPDAPAAPPAAPAGPAAVASSLDPFGLVGATLAGKYRIERVAAEGGFGVVYQGEHVALRSAVALKVLKIPPEFNESARAAFAETFAREATMIAALRHDHIVPIHDFGVATMPTGERAPWMALAWLAGETLADFLRARRGQGLPPAQALALVRPVLDALALAHEDGIAHRDLKPANIMLVPGRRGTKAVLMDFGVAKVMADDEAHAPSGATQTRGYSAYSPRYAAPEQVVRGRTGPWSDTHALGLILTELCVGAPAYRRADDATALGLEAVARDRPTPARFGCDVGAWEPVLAKALAADPGERYQTAGELLDALEAALPAGAPLVMPPVAASAPVPARRVATLLGAPPTPSWTTLQGGVQTRDLGRRPPARGAARWAGIFVLTALGVLGGALVAARTRHPMPRATARPVTAPPALSAAVAATAPVLVLPSPPVPAQPVPAVATRAEASPVATPPPADVLSARAPEPPPPPETSPEPAVTTVAAAEPRTPPAVRPARRGPARFPAPATSRPPTWPPPRPAVRVGGMGLE